MRKRQSTPQIKGKEVKDGGKGWANKARSLRTNMIYYERAWIP